MKGSSGTGSPQCDLADIRNIASDSRKYSRGAAFRFFKAQEMRFLRSVGLLEVMSKNHVYDIK
jgi:hypothetical protein